MLKVTVELSYKALDSEKQNRTRKPIVYLGKGWVRDNLVDFYLLSNFTAFEFLGLYIGVYTKAELAAGQNGDSMGRLTK